MIKLINLETGDVREWERTYSVGDRNYPKGYRVAGEISTDEWIELYCGLLKSKKE